MVALFKAAPILVFQKTSVYLAVNMQDVNTSTSRFFFFHFLLDMAVEDKFCLTKIDTI